MEKKLNDLYLKRREYNLTRSLVFFISGGPPRSLVRVGMFGVGFGTENSFVSGGFRGEVLQRQAGPREAGGGGAADRVVEEGGWARL